jgi:hypothetical protein
VRTSALRSSKKFVFCAFSEVPHSPGSMRQGFLFEHAGEPLSRYAVGFSATTGKPKGIVRPVLFGTAIALTQPRLFGLKVLGEGGWLKTLRMADYAPRKARPGSLQQSLFPYHEAWG